MLQFDSGIDGLELPVYTLRIIVSLLITGSQFFVEFVAYSEGVITLRSRISAFLRHNKPVLCMTYPYVL